MQNIKQNIKTPSDANGSQDLKPISKGIRDVLYSSVPRRSACNLRQCHALRGMREVNHIGRTPEEHITVQVLRKIERQRFGTANRYYSALDKAALLMAKINRRNAQIQEQAAEIEASNEELQNQQEELQQTNEELEEKSRLLEDQDKEVERKSREIGLAKEDLEEKAEQLTLTSKYKSEFLANMSHELRTPLNSLLILSKMLADNLDGNLTPKQVKHADTIHGAGAELLTLINDILDLAKIESGSMTAEVSAVGFADLKDWTEQSFQQLADDKKLTFEVQRDESLPAAIHTDVRRLQQVLKNLLSNAFKFTNEGGVTLRMSVAKEGWSADHPALSREDSVIAFTVADTGIGIPDDKQKIVFEAFQQADGTTSRKYGGTGLGLSISREIARLLCGELRVKSTPGKGSEFTLYLPQTLAPSDITPAAEEYVPELELAPSTPAPGAAEVGVHPAAALLLRSDVADDRESIQPGDRVLLIVEDDTRFAPLLLNIAREKGFRGLVATRGDIALALAEKYKPDAITLDVRLPDMHGLAVLDRLKHQASTRHIPVHIISVDEVRQRGLKMGAFAFLQKPVRKEKLDEALAGIKTYVERQVRKLLVVEDDEVHRNSIAELLGGPDVVTTAVGTGEEALAALKGDRYDCLVLDLGLPDMAGLELVSEIKKQEKLADLPIIVYTGRELTPAEETDLKRVTETIIVKDVRSPERLLDETALFLHRVEANLPQDKKRMIQELHQKDPVISGKRMLIVDDDVRNVFALTSLLEHHEVQVFYATNGKDGLRVLQETPDIDVVLMDIMMPEMDGYEATRAIRNIPRFKSLPIIALTAKAMKGDREKCIEAGTSDYIAKPVEADQLLSLLRVWLYK